MRAALISLPAMPVRRVCWAAIASAPLACIFLYVALLALVARLPHSFNGACNCELFLHEGLEGGGGGGGGVGGASSLVVFSLRSSLRRKVLNRRVPTYLKTGAQFLSVSRAVRIANNDAARFIVQLAKGVPIRFHPFAVASPRGQKFDKSRFTRVGNDLIKIVVVERDNGAGSARCHGARKESKAKHCENYLGDISTTRLHSN